MIRMLQKKFVFTSMAAITALLLFLLGAINIANFVMVRTETNATLAMLSESEGDVRNLTPNTAGLPGMERGKERLFTGGPKNDYDRFMASNFFAVRFDSSGAVIYVDTSRTSAVNTEEAVELAREALAESTLKDGTASGKIGRFRYQIADIRGLGGTSAVFLDTSDEKYSYLRVILLSSCLGIACWGVMLLLVILLSKKAIRPIAENMERQKQFITNAGHEIKTPLAIIQSNTEAMELYNGENKWSRNIKEQTLRLSGLMQNLLTLARMDDGAAAIQASDFNFSQLLTGSLQAFLQPMEMKNIALQTRIPPDIPLHADRSQVEQLLSILLDNAVKYTDQGGEIRIELQRQEKHVRLSVQNTCAHLPEVPPDRLFERFYRGDAARTQKNGGYGIGLSAASCIAEANHASIHAEYLQPSAIRFVIFF